MAEHEHLTIEDYERYTHGRLDAPSRARLQLHLKSCPICKSAWDRFRGNEQLAEELRRASCADQAEPEQDDATGTR